VVVTCIPQTGHIAPLMPLAQALVAQGDEVVVASGPDAEAAATASGLAFRPVAPGFGEWFEALRARTRGTPGDGLAPERIEGYFLPRLFGEVGMALMVDGLLDAARSLQPDLMVFDPLLLAAPLVGALLDIPLVHHTIGPLTEPGVLDLVADAVSPIWRQFGRDVPPAAGVYEATTLTVCPPSLDRSAASLADVQPLRPTPMPVPAGPLPFELPRPGRPVVYVTLGTFSNNLDLFRSLLEALADEPVNVVATIGADKDPADLEPWPGNARVERFVPQAELLPHCAAVIHHAGAGTTFGILAHGLPSVALPQSADNFTIGRRLAAAGAARTLMPDEVRADEVRKALDDVVTGVAYREHAARLAAEIGAMPDPASVALLLRERIGAGSG
jgi:UDP:flavonoid glycosyltransferase YjiC (YdhE family)